jgi:hypothetical protein
VGVRRGLAGLLLLVPCLVRAEDRFDALRAQARPYDGGLGQFLEEYLGDCGDNPNCRSHTKDFQAQSKGERFYALVREDEAAMLGMSERPTGGGEYTVEVTPFFPGNEHALTNATPKKTDSKGNPILAVLMLPGQLPDGETIDSVARMFKNRGVRLELLFRPEEPWALPKKGGSKLIGLRAKLDAMRVTSRSGALLALWVAEK